ncbi:MAG: hypothetical protein LBI82_03765 [Dysgonamonadaceae bacterium]|jgi:hypothetical protein|nr:hypothetical protein [Dysgonamonadaceae bacterium]
MNLQMKLDKLHRETVSSLCSIKEFPEGLLPHAVYVEEETEQSLPFGNPVYNPYNLIRIFPDGTCILENPETGTESKRQLNEINTNWLITVWSYYRDLSGARGQTPVKNSITKLLQQMNPIASALITSLFITDFTVHDTKFIRQTKAKTPFIWLVYESGTHLYTTNEVGQLQDFLKILDYYESYSEADFCLFRYDGNKLFPVFPNVTRMLTESELTKYTPLKN